MDHDSILTEHCFFYVNLKSCGKGLIQVAFVTFSDRLFRTMADIVVAEGYAAAGYEYINIDDCWLEKERDYAGQLVPDRQRFPYGMKSLSNYVSLKKQFLPHFCCAMMITKSNELDDWHYSSYVVLGLLPILQEKLMVFFNDFAKVHSKGLKFGIYEDYGNYTCAGYPGVIGHLQDDAALFASWDVDYVKLDGCYAHPSDMDQGNKKNKQNRNLTLT